MSTRCLHEIGLDKLLVPSGHQLPASCAAHGHWLRGIPLLLRPELAWPCQLATYRTCSPHRCWRSIEAGLGLRPGEVDLVEEVADEGFGSLVGLHPGGRRDVAPTHSPRVTATTHSGSASHSSPTRTGSSWPEVSAPTGTRTAPPPSRPSPPRARRASRPRAASPGPAASRSCVAPCVPSRPPLVGPARKTLAKTSDFATRVIHRPRRLKGTAPQPATGAAASASFHAHTSSPRRRTSEPPSR